MVALNELKSALLATLKRAGIEAEEARLEVQLIIEHTTGRSTADQLAYPQWQVPAAAVAAAETIAGQRALRKPLQYLLGEQWFMGLRFTVAEGVLIPRADTETLVQAVQAHLSRIAAPLFVDVGTGSGAIAISLLKLLPSARAWAIDVSPAACEIAQANAQEHGVQNRLTVQRIDWLHFDGDEKLDAVVSNPPYIDAATWAELQPEVRVFEPQEALLGSRDDGLGFYTDLSRKAGNHLRPKGLLAVEVGFGQADAVRKIFESDGWTKTIVYEDLNRIARCICAFHAAEAIENEG